MTWPLVVLAACSLLAGGFAYAHAFRDFLALTPALASLPAAEEGFHLDIAGLSTLIALSGFGLAAYLYLGDRRQIEALTRFAKSRAGLRLYDLSYGKFFFDPLYMVLVVLPMRVLAWLAAWLDRWLVDGLVNSIGRIPARVGSWLRPLHGGLVPYYALAMALGLLILLGRLIWW